MHSTFLTCSVCKCHTYNVMIKHKVYPVSVACSPNQWQSQFNLKLQLIQSFGLGWVTGSFSTSCFCALAWKQKNRKKQVRALSSLNLFCCCRDNLPFLGKADQEKDPWWEIPPKILWWKHFGLILTWCLLNWEICENQWLIWCASTIFVLPFCLIFYWGQGKCW